MSVLQSNTQMLQALQVDNQTLKSEQQSTKQLLNFHTQSIAKLESQMGQLAQTVGRRDEGKLPSQPETNPKGQYGATSSKNHIHYHEQVQAVTTGRG